MLKKTTTIFALAAGLFTLPALAQERFDSWQKSCATNEAQKSVCYIETRLANQADQKVIFVWRMTLQESGAATALARVPAGVLIAPGVELLLAEKQPTRIPFFSCNADSCEIRFNMEAGLVKNLRTKKTVPVKFVNQQSQAIQFEIPMKGFAAALTALGGDQKTGAAKKK